MKTFIKVAVLFLCIILLNEAKAATSKELRVGATAVPHAEILEFVKPMLAKKGINLRVIIFQDYVLPNKALESRDLDVNYFQHEEYLKQQIKENKYNFKIVTPVHIEPLGIYSKKYGSLDFLPKTATIIISNSVADRARTMLLLEKAELLIFKEGVNKEKSDLKDIEIAKLKLKKSVDPALLPKLYNLNEADLIVINTNYAIQAGLNPLRDALMIENEDSPYANILVARENNANDPAIKELAKALVSKETKEFIINKYKGSIIPVN